MLVVFYLGYRIGDLKFLRDGWERTIHAGFEALWPARRMGIALRPSLVNDNSSWRKNERSGSKLRRSVMHFS